MPHESAVSQEPSREELAQTTGPVLVEFGAAWCGICRGFAPQVQQQLREFSQVSHLKIEDGPGRPLGRAFRVKLWPTFVFFRDGQVLGQVVRPSADELRAGLASITTPASSEN